MAFANASISDIIATTIQNRSGDLADSLTQNNIVLKRLEERGNIETFSGGNVILQELMYDDPTTNNAQSYSGFETLNISPDSPISSAQYQIKQYSSAVTISGLEQIQNEGKERIIDLLSGRMKVAEARLRNRISSDIYGDGTGNNGKNLDGLAAAISTTPNTGTYGGIDASAWAFWRNKVQSGTAVTASNVQSLMTSLAIQLRRMEDHTDLILADNNFWTFYNSSLQAIQRVNTIDGDDKAGSGFPGLMFFGAGARATVEIANGAFQQSPINRMWFLNTNYIHWRPHAKRNFVSLPKRESINQDASVGLYVWAGNLTTSNRFLQGILTN